MEKLEQNTTNTTRKSLLPSPRLRKAGDSLSTLIFYISIIFFIVGFGIRDIPTPFGWYQQFLPNLNNMPISDVTFVDSLNGFAITGNQTPNDTNYILKTTNSGDDWSIVYRGYRNYFRVKFLNSNTGFVCGGFNVSSGELLKTTNSGINWFNIPTQGVVAWRDMSVLNVDTIWLVDSDPLVGGVYRTTNGGVNWQLQLNLGPSNPDHIYMYNARIGFISKTSNTELRKTIDGGQTWTLLSGTGTGSFNDMYFIDSLTGWKCKTVGGGGWLMGKTTDGGLNWAEEILPSGGNISNGSSVLKFSNINKDTVWACGGILFYPGQGPRAFLYRTVNSGDTWFMQIPDTSYRLPDLSYISFTNKLNGWSYRTNRGIHTLSGGDSTFLLNVHQISSEIPKQFKLSQNYPNPFNPRTVIKYQAPPVLPVGEVFIKLAVYDLLGREVALLVNQKQRAGTYQVDFSGEGFSSGVYFYSLFADDRMIDTKKMLMIK